MADFNPTQARVDFAWQPTAGLPVAVAAFDKPMRSLAGLDLSPEMAAIQTQSIDGTGHQGDYLPGPISLDPAAFPIEVHFSEFPYLLAAAFQGGTQTTPVGSVQQQHLATRLSGTTYGPLFSLVVDRDDGRPMVLGDGRVAQIQLSISKGEVVGATAQLGFAWYSFFTDRVIDTGSDVPVMRGLADYATLSHATASEQSYKFEISTGLSGTTVVVKGQAGIATAVGAETTSVEVDTWTELLDSDTGLPLGQSGQPIEIFLPVAGTWSLADEYHFDLIRASLATAYGTLGFANEIDASLLIDGSKICLESFQLTIDFPYATQPCIGQQFPSKNLRQGRVVPTVSIERQYVDLALAQRLLAGQTARFQCSLYGASAFSDNTLAEVSFYVPKLTLQGRLPQFSDATYQESYELVGSSDASNPFGNGVVDSVEVICKNDIADLSA